MSSLETLPKKYPITAEYSGGYSMCSVDDVVDWSKDRSAEYIEYLRRNNEFVPDFDTGEIGGLLTVQTSLSYDEEKQTFFERGSAPNYFGDTWSFATCRWKHRGHGKRGWRFGGKFFTEDPEDEAVLRPQLPTLVINAANTQEVDGHTCKPVVSVAFVTHGFWTVDAYARYLLENCSEHAIGHRLTHDTNSRFHLEAIAFGDCHADREGNVNEPPEGHDHHRGTESSCGCRVLSPHKDTEDDHVKCLSMPGFWHTFTDGPEFELDIHDWGVKFIHGEEGLRTHLREFGQL